MPLLLTVTAASSSFGAFRFLGLSLPLDLPSEVFR